MPPSPTSMHENYYALADTGRTTPGTSSNDTTERKSKKLSMQQSKKRSEKPDTGPTMVSSRKDKQNPKKEEIPPVDGQDGDDVAH